MGPPAKQPTPLERRFGTKTTMPMPSMRMPMPPQELMSSPTPSSAMPRAPMDVVPQAGVPVLTHVVRPSGLGQTPAERAAEIAAGAPGGANEAAKMSGGTPVAGETDAQVAARQATQVAAFNTAGQFLGQTGAVIIAALNSGSQTEIARINAQTAQRLAALVNADGTPRPGANQREIDSLGALYRQTQMRMPSSGMSESTKTILTVGGVVVGATALGLLAWYLTKPATRGNPDKDAYTGRFAPKSASRRSDGRFRPGYQHGR